MNKDKRMFVVEVVYESSRRRKWFVFETRKDAREFGRVLGKRRSVLGYTILPAARGPSNVGAR